jgi:hypothetical protein
LAVVLLASSCGPADGGFGVEISNDCEVDVEFFLDGGAAPAGKLNRSAIRLEASQSKTYSVIAGEDGAYVWLLAPTEMSPIAIPQPPGGTDITRVSLGGSPCLAVVIAPG